MPNGKYERYIKLFSGAVFILIVIGPLTRSLKLDEKLAYAYEQIRFVQDTGEFERRLWGIETERMGQIIRQYEEAVAQDVAAMAEAEGYRCVEASVEIEGDAASERFGQVVGMELILERGDGDEWMEVGSNDVEPETFLEKETEQGEEGEQAAGKTAVEQVEDIRIQVEARVNGNDQETEAGRRDGIHPEGGEDGNAGERRQKGLSGARSRAHRAREQKEQEELYGFQRKVAGYYGLEEADIRITK